jgi:hypothetical protein
MGKETLATHAKKIEREWNADPSHSKPFIGQQVGDHHPRDPGMMGPFQINSYSQVSLDFAENYLFPDTREEYSRRAELIEKRVATAKQGSEELTTARAELTTLADEYIGALRAALEQTNEDFYRRREQ